MASNLRVPISVEDPLILRRFLEDLVLSIDTSTTNTTVDINNTEGLVTQVSENTTSIQDNADDINRNSNSIGQLKSSVNIITSANYTSNPIQTVIADLAQTISNPPTQTEVQDISDKIDVILQALRDANIIEV